MDTGKLDINNLFITGGTGTLGKALLKWAHSSGLGSPITVYSRDPMKQVALRQQFPDLNLRCVIGDVRDYDRLYMAMVGHDVVIHAAAQKHVTLGEVNTAETLAINTTGSQNVVLAAAMAGVKRVVGISTDKACYPVNSYGISKAAMERLFLDTADIATTTYHLCRYGNVMGSNGSVLPFWKAMVEAGRPLPITDPNMTRFWLTEEEAVELVLTALQSPARSIIVPKAPALAMWQLADYAFPDSPIEEIGARPGEKAHECLLMAEEAYRANDMGDHWVIGSDAADGEYMQYQSGYFSSDPERELVRSEIETAVRGL